MHRREASHAQPERRRPRAAIIEESNGAVLSGRGIGGIEHAPHRLALFIADGQRARRLGIGDALAIHPRRPLAALRHFLDRRAGPIGRDRLGDLFGMLLLRVGRVLLRKRGRSQRSQRNKSQGDRQPHGQMVLSDGAILCCFHKAVIRLCNYPCYSVSSLHRCACPCRSAAFPVGARPIVPSRRGAEPGNPIPKAVHVPA